MTSVDVPLAPLTYAQSLGSRCSPGGITTTVRDIVEHSCGGCRLTDVQN